MVCFGRIQNGVAVLVPPASLPEGTAVRIEVEAPDQDFWRTKSIEQLICEQEVQPITSSDDLKIDWPANESVDDLIALVQEVQR